MCAIPRPGGPRWRWSCYREVVDRIRTRDPRLILNLTTGPGGRFDPSEDDPKVAGPRTTLTVPEKRVEHVTALRPEICTLDLNTMTFGTEVVINTPSNIARMATVIRAAGVLPELEVFDSGDIRLAHDLIAQNVLQGPGLYSLVLGIKYGFPASAEADGICTRPAAQGCHLDRVRDRAAWSFPPSRSATCSAAMCASGLRTTSFSIAACWRRATRPWCGARVRSSSVSAARSQRRRRRAHSSACQRRRRYPRQE